MREGIAALNAGQLERAGELCKQVLKEQPELPQAHFLVGLVALEGRDRRTAFQAFGSVTKLDPAHSAGWAQLARLFMGEGQVARADAAVAEAAKNEPDDPLVQDLIGTIYSLMGEYGLAHEWFEKAVANRPDNVAFLLNLANNHVYYGETQAAQDLFQRIIELQNDSPQAHWALAGSRKARDDDHIRECAELVLHGNQHPRFKAFYYYAIGKECEDLERWEDAFEAFSRGAGARRSTVEYDEEREIRMFRYLEETFTADWLDRVGEGNPDPSPIFVLGQPRTGTTLIERIITSHSRVTSAGELQQFSLGIRRLSGYKDPVRFSSELFEAALAVEPAALGGIYLETTQRVRGDTPHFVDKLPQNYLCIPLILAALPKAKIVHLTRDPMDACFAGFKQLFADAYLHSYDQREMARHHGRYRTLMGIWRTRFPGRFYDISYEDTTGEFETNVRSLLEFLDLPFEQACLDFHTQDTAVSTASAAQVREPAHTRSVGRWRQYEEQLAPMIEELSAFGVVPTP